MRWSISSSRWSLAVVGILVLLLAVLATLQYRWIAQLSEAELVRLKESLNQDAVGFCEDFDKEIARAHSVFALGGIDDGELAQALADRMAEWRSGAVWPEFVGELFIIRLQDSGESALLCFDEQARELRQCDWRQDLLPIRRHLRDAGPRVPVVDGALPGMVLVIENRGAPRGRPPSERQPPRNHLIIRFDLDFIVDTVLPRLAEEHFAVNGGLPHLLSVTSAARPGEVIFQTAPAVTGRKAQPDASDTFMGLRSFPEFSFPPGGGFRDRRPPPPSRSGAQGGGPPRQNPPPPELQARSSEGLWVLDVRHPQGSLELVVSMARRRNMAISLAMLLMLAIAAGLMVASTRRERQLARQQMDFVAAVSHELKTPLTAMRSAGQNLADGIVSDPEGVRSYGLLIEREGRRLTEMIGRVLAFSGIRSGRQIYRKQAVDLAEIVEAVLGDSRTVLEENGIEVHSEFTDDLPRVTGDAIALRQVVSNLIDNALKYGAGGRWLGVRVDFDSTEENGEVRISVSDRGPGIPKREQSTIFEAFCRGEEVVGNGVSGSGLGLAVVKSIVEAHGGSIDVDSPPRGGATFVVRLPAESVRPIEREDGI